MGLIKKGLIITMGMVMAFSLTACGEKAEPQNKSGDGILDTEHEIDLEQNDATKPEERGQDTEDKSKQEQSQYFGKVKGIIGNEIDVDLAKNDLSENAQPEEDEEYKEDLGSGEMAASISIEAIEGESTFNWTANIKQEKMELEYTGETKSFTIPAGTQIVGLDGKEAAMTDIKEGSVLYITTSGTDKAPVINVIQIME